MTDIADALKRLGLSDEAIARIVATSSEPESKPKARGRNAAARAARQRAAAPAAEANAEADDAAGLPQVLNLGIGTAVVPLPLRTFESGRVGYHYRGFIPVDGTKCYVVLTVVKARRKTR